MAAALGPLPSFSVYRCRLSDCGGSELEGAEISYALVVALRLLATVTAALGPLPHLVRLLVARVGLFMMSGDRRDAQILARRH